MTSEIVTIERHVLDQQRFFPEAADEFTNTTIQRCPGGQDHLP
jgi:hypothetical protein